MACSNYYISIIDTQADPDDSYVVTGYVNPGYIFPQHEEGGMIGTGELVAARSIQLSHRGGDRLDVPIIGSSLRWTFVGLDCSDGRYHQLFTGDENRFEVTMSDGDNKTIWRGFLLPDAYQEPYRNYVQDVSFEATDGLGRLKGKYLDHYPSEISVVGALTQILTMTGVNLSLWFSPAIVNHNTKDFREIYIPTAGWAGRDAYSILEGLTESLASTLYQSQGRWNLVGWNLKLNAVYSAEVYSSYGFFEREELVEKDNKQIESLAGGNVALQPPYGTVTVSHEQQDISIEYQNPEIDWVEYEAVPEEDSVLYAPGWFMSPEFPMLFDEEFEVHFRYHENQSLKASLLRRPYVQKGQRYGMGITFQGHWTEEESDPEERIWADVDPFTYFVKLGDTVLFHNVLNHPEGTYKQVALVESDTGLVDAAATTEIDLGFTAFQSGLLNIEIHPLKKNVNLEPGEGNYRLEAVTISEMEIGRIGFEPQIVDRRTVNSEFTTTKVINLEYADDVSGMSSAFRLAELDTVSGTEVFSFTSYRFFRRGDEWFYIVDLKTASLVEANIDSVYDNLDDLKNIIRVEYNWAGSQQHAIVSSEPFFVIVGGGLRAPIYVRLNAYNTVQGPRPGWQQWGDSVYSIEQHRFVEAYADIVERINGAPLERLETTAWENLKIDDFIRLNYRGDKSWVPSSVEWDVDAGRTRLVAVRAGYYGGDYPPIVQIQDTGVAVGGSTSLEAEAVSPKGVIESYSWVILEGTGVLSNPDQNSTGLSFSSGTVVVQVTVTDDKGQTGTDTLRVHASENISLTLSEVVEDKEWALNWSPELPAGTILNLKGYIFNRLTGAQGGYPSVTVKLFINDIEAISTFFELSAEGQEGHEATWTASENWDFSISLLPGDEVSVTMDWDLKDIINSIRSTFNVTSAEFAEGHGIINGLPLRAQVSIPFDFT